MLYTLYTAAHYFLWIVNAAIIIYCILTWVAPRSAARYWLERFINPFIAPFRRGWGAISACAGDRRLT